MKLVPGKGDKPTKDSLILKLSDVYFPWGRELYNSGRNTAEEIIEFCMVQASGGLYKNMPQGNHHYDFTDYSDKKTTSIQLAKPDISIADIASPNREIYKYGDLRVTIFNPYRDRLDFYFIPRWAFGDLAEFGENHRRDFRAVYNIEKDIIEKWYPFRVGSFEELAQKPSTITEVRQQTIDDLYWGRPGKLIATIREPQVISMGDSSMIGAEPGRRTETFAQELNRKLNKPTKKNKSHVKISTKFNSLFNFDEPGKD